MSVKVGSVPVAVDYSVAAGKLYVANQGSNNVSIIDLKTESVTATTTVGLSPSGIWVDESGNVYVANQGGNSLSVIKAGSDLASELIPVQTLPVAVAGSAITGSVYVVNQGSNSVSVVNPATSSVTETVIVGTGPSAIVVHPDTNVVYVANQGSNNISLINGFSNLPVTTISVGNGPAGLALNVATKRLYVANTQGSSISVIDTDTNAVLATVPLTSAPRSVAVFQPGNLVYATQRLADTATVLDGETNKVLGTVSTGDAPMGVRVRAEAAAMYVANSGAGTVSLLPVVTVSGPPLTAPAKGAMLANLSAELHWGEVRGATQYHLQVTPFNNDGPGVNLIRNIESTYTVPEPEMGIGNYVMLGGMTYSWRVRVSYATAGLDENSRLWGPWSDLFMFKTPAPNDEDVRLMEPADGALVASRTPTLVWGNEDSSVFYYEVQASKDPNFGFGSALYFELRHGALSTPPNSYTIPAALPLEPQSLYYWRVRPRVQGDGKPVLWSTVRNFRTP